MAQSSVSVYRMYSNSDLRDMIDDLFQRKLISDELREKFLDAVFKRHHDRHPDDLSRREAQKRNAIQWYYRRKLLKMVEENAETKIDE